MKKAKSKSKKYLKTLWFIYGISLFSIILFFIGVSIGMLGPIPSFEELENPKSNLASEIYSYDGKVIGKLYIENRTNVEYTNLPQHLVNALVATEDIRFESHSGIDIRGVFRVMFKTLLSRDKRAGGGSTITQQLAKNLFEREHDMTKLKLITTKFREWITAIKLERNYSKQEIIIMYLNTVDFGSHAFGINSASYTYFKVPPDSLKTEEAAVLVGMLKAPTYYNPIRNPENSINRRNVVLSQMRKYNFITKTEYDSLVNIPIHTEKFQVQDHTAGMAAYFREYLRNIMTAREPVEKNYSNKGEYQEAGYQWDNNPLYGWCNKNTKPDGTNYNIYRDGLKIYTTIDSRMQNYAEQAVTEHIGTDIQPAFYNQLRRTRNAPFSPVMTKSDVEKLIYVLKRRSDRYLSMRMNGYSVEDIEKSFREPLQMKVFSWNGEIDTVITPMDSLLYYQWFLQAGFTAIEPQTGHVKAYVGGINYKNFKYDHVTQSRRQVGSTFKPFLYTLAIRDLGYSPCTKVPCIPVTFDLYDGTKWTPKNSGKEDKEGEMVTLKYALALSINWISAHLMRLLSPQVVVNLARNMGIRSPMPPVYSLALGVSEVTLTEMVAAKTVYANKGVYSEPLYVTRIEDNNGNIIQTFLPKSKEVLDEQTAYVMLDMLKGVVQYGTGMRLRFKYNITNPVAGKTGTTDNNSDGWFIGITPNLIAGAWVGGQVMQIHFLSTRLGQGANTALPIWAKFMNKVYDDPTINLSKEDFEKPERPLIIEIDCDKYDQQHKDGDLQKNPWGFE